MNLIFFSFSDSQGGAAKASYSIYQSIKSEFKYCSYLCVDKKSKDSVKINGTLKNFYFYFLRIIEKLIIIFFKNNFHQSLNIFSSFNLTKINQLEFDILNLHWINRCSISLQEIMKIKKKLLISLHDMWFFSGTEHYFIGNKKNNLLDNYIFNLKKKIFNKNNIFYIAHSRWMYNNIIKKMGYKKNKVFLCKYYPIDTQLFKPRNKNFLRKKYNISTQKKIILFSAQSLNDKRKGEIYFYKIASYFSNSEDFHFILVGKNYLKDSLSSLKNCTYISFLNHNDLAEIYSLSDIYICTSVIDNLPLTVLEAMSSGLVVISFNNGGVCEVLSKSGYIVPNKNYKRVIQILNNLKKSEIQKKSISSRKFAIKNFKKKAIKKKYINIINKINKINVS